MRPSLQSVITVFAILVSFGVVSAQNQPKALLRTNLDSAAPAGQYYIEVFADVPLKQSVYDALGGAMPPKIGLLTSKGVPVTGTASFNNRLVVSPDDHGQRKRYRVYLPENMAPFTDFAKKKYAVLLIDYPDDSNNPVVRAISVDRVLSRELTTDFPLCRRNQFGLFVDYDRSDPYSFDRAKQLYTYLETLKNDSSKLQNIEIRVEPLTRTSVETRHVNGITIAPETMAGLNRNGTLSACFATDGDIPSEKFDAELVLTADAPVEVVEPKVVTGLAGISAEAFSAVFPGKEKAVGLRPIDKDLNIGLSFVSSVADVEKPDKSIVRERDTTATLDLRLGLFRNVEQLTVKGLPKPGQISVKKECGPVTEFKVPTAALPGSITIGGFTLGISAGLNLRGVIIGAQQCLHYKYLDLAGAVSDRNPGFPSDPIFTPYITGLEPPDITAGTYSVFTPFYLDAKVSTGRINKDTSSLNRVVFGMQEELRYYANNNRFPTYYRFLLQANHASDRDFKQREFKGTFEFHPVFAPLNHPFDPRNVNILKKSLCPDCKPPYKLLPIRYGYEFVPVFGAEIGRTYYRRRPAEGLKPSDTIKRLYFGVDTTIYPTPNITLTGVERFYVRGEKRDDRFHNYFLGEFTYRLGHLATGRAAQSVFFSWERGGQPPFDDPDVNVLKFGYRISAATLFSRD